MRRLTFLLLFLLVACSPNYQSEVSLCHQDNLTSFQSCVNQKAEKLGLGICDAIDQDLRDVCSLHAAIGKDDVNICKQIDNKETRTNCYGSIGLYNDRPDVLELIDDADKRHDWYITLAIRKQDPNLCRKILDDADAHGRCFYELVKITPKPEYCFYIDANTIHKDMCYLHLARALDDASYCIPMSDGFLKNRCVLGDDYETYAPPDPQSLS